MAQSSTQSTEDFGGIAGPQGLRITAAKVAFNMQDEAVTVKPSYLKGDSIRLIGPKLSASTIKITPGGVFGGLRHPPLAIKAGRAVAFDADGNGRLESFYLDKADLALSKPLNLLGLQAEEVSVELRELTNHPALLQRMGMPRGQWLGSIGLRGKKITFPAISNLKVTPKASGRSAFSASYNLGSGDLDVNLDRVSYSSSLFSLAMKDGLFRLFNGRKRIALKGAVSLSVPRLPLGTLAGQAELQFVGKALDRLSATLQWTNDGSRSFALKGFSLQPLQASIALGYGSRVADRYLSFKNGQFQFSFGDQAVKFSGDVDLTYDRRGAFDFKTTSLKLASDSTISLGGFKLKLLASDPLAPTKLTLQNKKGVLVPSLSGRVEFPDLGGLALMVPEGGISYGPSGWQFNDVKLGLSSPVDLGPIRFGPQAYARYQNGLVTVNPDLSLNLDVFNLALKPVAQLIADVVTPFTAPVVKVFKQNIDLRSNAGVRDRLDSIRSDFNVDLLAAWDALVAYLEAVPGNPYQDNSLTAGELLDFVAYKAFDLVQRYGPDAANAAFRETFNTDLPSWLLNLPAGIDYATISMSATVARIDAINELAASLLQQSTSGGQWVSMPELQFQLAAGSSQSALAGGATARESLLAQLRQLSSDLQRFDQLNQAQAPQIVRELKTLPLQFGAGFKVPLFEDPIDVLLKMIGNKPFDLLRTDFNLGSGVELNLGIPLAQIAALVPQLAPVAAGLEAVNATLDLRTGLGVQAALSVGLSSTVSELASVVKEVANRTASIADLAKSFAGRDPITGQALGLFVGQTPNKSMLQLSPFVQAGLAISRFGLSAMAYGRADGVLNLNLTSEDGLNRAYLSDLLTGLSGLPGFKVDGSLYGELGLNFSGWVGSANPKVRFPVVENANLFDVAPRPLPAQLA